MSLFLVQAAYTSESWKTQIQTQENVQRRIQPVIEELGGHIVGAFYAFGDYDIVVLMEMPGDEAAAAFALTAGAGGAVRSLKTTKLMTIDQGLDAMRKASKAASLYIPPLQEKVPV